MSKEEKAVVEKVIRVVKCNTSYAIGWGVLEDGTILIEIDGPSWERLEENIKKRNAMPDMDYLLGSTITQLFSEVK